MDKTTRHLYGLLGGKIDAPIPEWEILSRGSERRLSSKPPTPDRRDEAFPLCARSNFLWDRLRSVRQDISLQDWRDGWVMRTLEEMVRFAIASEYLLCESTGEDDPPSAAAAADPRVERRIDRPRARAFHDSHLHVEQLGKTLATLAECYERGRELGDFEDEAETKRNARGSERRLAGVSTRFPNEPEMFAYRLFLSLDARGPFRKLDDLSFIRELRSVPKSVLVSEEVQFALEVKRAYDAGHHATFFRLVSSRRCSYLQACCLHAFVRKARFARLRTAETVWSKTPLSARELGVDVLRLDLRFGDRVEGPGEDDFGSSTPTELFAAATAVANGAAVETDADGKQKIILAKGSAASFGSGEGARDAFGNRREQFIDAKAPTIKGGFFRWGALIEGKAGR